MQWLDVFGPPGVGKSTLVDDLWPPRCIDVKQSPGYPREWAPFLEEVQALLVMVRRHPSYAACASMINRSFAKMATVHGMKDDRVYIQTGFAQRGLGIGWRLPDPEMIAPYFEKMPVSRGVIMLRTDALTIMRRNVERGKDRSHMVPLMMRPMQIAAETLKARGVRFMELDTRDSVGVNVERIRHFAR